MAKRDADFDADDLDADLDADEVEEAAETVDEDLDDADVAEEAEDAYDEEPYEEEPPRLKPKVTVTTIVFCFLNVAAAVGFLFILMLDYEKHNAYALAAVANEQVLRGDGTQEDRNGATAGEAALPRPTLSNEALREAFKRPGAQGGSDFAPVEGGFDYRPYADLPDDMKSSTVEAEMLKLQTKFPEEIKAVGKKLVENMAKAGDPEKQKRVLGLLFPLCRDPMQVEKLEAKVKASVGAPLDSLLEEAIQRRILADILLPVELFRPSDHEAALPITERLADLDAVKLDAVQNLLTSRLKAATEDKHSGAVHFGKEWDGKDRWTIEKRQNAAFLLISVAYARKHLDRSAKFTDQLLDPAALERAQKISGLYDFTQAAKAYDTAVRRLEERVLANLALDREGFDVTVKNELRRSTGFAEKQADLIFQIRLVQLRIRQADERIKDLEQQIDRSKKVVEERTKQEADVYNRVVEERTKTRKAADELRGYQQQLFDAQKILSDAVERNLELTRRIQELSGLKGDQP